MEQSDELWGASWIETVAITIAIMANIVTIVVGLGKLVKLLQGRKEMQEARR